VSVEYRIQLIVHVSGPDRDWDEVAKRLRSHLLGDRIGGHFRVFDVEIDEPKDSEEGEP